MTHPGRALLPYDPASWLPCQVIVVDQYVDRLARQRWLVVEGPGLPPCPVGCEPRRFANSAALQQYLEEEPS